MMRLFARRQDSRPSSEPGSAQLGRPIGRVGATMAARPEAEALDSRLLMASANLLADTTASSDLSDRVAQVLKPYFDQDQIPGISVAIVTDGQVALAQGYGLSNVATGAPVAADTRFDIGSVTKTFTAIGVLLLYQESQGTSHPLDLNAPISEYLNNTRSFKLPRKWSGVTTMELLDMTSGIGNGPGNQPWQAQVAVDRESTPSSSPRDEDLLQRHELRPARRAHRAVDRGKVRHLHPEPDPGTARDVRNPGAGPVRPRSRTRRSATTRPGTGSWPRAAVQNGPAMYAAAGMVSTAQDMATYMTALLSGQSPRSRDLQLDVDLDTDAAIRGESPLQLRARPGMGYGDRHERRARQGRQGRVGPRDSSLRSSSTPTRTAESSSPSTPILTAVGMPSGVTALQVAESVYAATQTGSRTGG